MSSIMPGNKNIFHFHILEQLGQGGMAIIYKAYDTSLEREVAIKLIRTRAIPSQQHERLMKRFQREAKAQAQFNHPNIVPVFDYGVHEGMPYLVMEYIPGGTLKDRITGPVEWQQAIEWILPIADALAYAHDQGIIHRDVKPSNILITAEGKPILTDFGIAKVLETDEGTLTGTGMGVGTPEYMAPEQWRGESTEASDQYALGVVLYELLTGQKPFTAETPVAIALKQMRDPLTRPSELAPGIPEAVEKVIFKALARSPEDRFTNVGEFVQKLGTAAGFDGFVDDKPKNNNLIPTQANQKDKRNKRKVWLWVTGAIVILGGIISATLLFGNGFINGNLDGLISQGLPTHATDELIIHDTETPTSTPTPTETSIPTSTPTLTPTPTPQYLINFLRDDAIWQYDLFNEESQMIMDIVPQDSYYGDSTFGLNFDSYLWNNSGRYLVYAARSSAKPRSSPLHGVVRTYKGLYLYDTELLEEIVLVDKASYHRIIEWSPNDQYFFFYSEFEGLPGLYLYDINSEEFQTVMILSEEKIISSVNWDIENNNLLFCLSNGSSGFCKKYNFQNNLIENAANPNNYQTHDNPLKLFWEQFYEPGMDVRPELRINEATYVVFWQYEDQGEGGAVLINMDEGSLTSLEGPDYLNAFDFYLVYQDDEISVFTDYFFTGCYHLFRNNGFSKMSKYCFTSSNESTNPVQKSMDGEFLFIFTSDQIHFINLESFEIVSKTLFGQILAPKLVCE